LDDAELHPEEPPIETRLKQRFLKTLAVGLLQLGYTFLFGVYAGFLFLRCRSLIPVGLVHSFCNVMGFPSFGSSAPTRYRFVIWASYLAGMVLFFLLLYPLTSPQWTGVSGFGDDVYLPHRDRRMRI